MKKYLIPIIITSLVLIFFVSFGIVRGVTKLSVPQGGTGAGTFTLGEVLVGNGTNPIQATTSITNLTITNATATNLTVSQRIAANGEIDLTGSDNIQLNANFISGDGDDEGLSVDSTGATTLSNTLNVAGNTTLANATATNLGVLNEAIFTDNSKLSLGTGADSQLYYDGTDTFLDLRAVGTGDLMIALAGSFPSPDPGVHIWRGDAGLVTSISNAGLVLENSAAIYIHFLTPNSNTSGILWGDPEADITGGLIYNQSTDALEFRLVNNTTRLLYSAGAFAFQEATTISTPINTDLTLSNSGTGDIILSAGGNVGIATISPSHLLSVGAGNGFTVDGSGNVTSSTLGLGGDYINEFAGTGLTVTGNALTVDLGTAIDAGEITAAAIDGDDINSNIAGRSLTLTAASPDTLDADPELYTDTKCIWFEDPTAADDFKSIWRNSTGNDLTLTELWAESDQTVTFMLQVDDGSPADIDSVDLAPAAGEAEDTSLDGDTTLAQSEELDLDLVSVSGTPTFVSICWTFTWND